MDVVILVVIIIKNVSNRHCLGIIYIFLESESSSLMPLVGAVVAAEGIQEEVGLNPGTRMAGKEKALK